MATELDLDDAKANVSGDLARQELDELRRERDDLKSLVVDLRRDLKAIRDITGKKIREINLHRQCHTCGWVHGCAQDGIADIGQVIGGEE